MKPGADNQVSFSEIRIQDGVLAYEDAANHVTESSTISTFRWPGRRSRAPLPRPGNSTGAASASTARSAPATSSPHLSGDRSGLKARLASAPLKLAFDGTVADRTSMMMEGTLTVDSTSLRNALRWTGQAPPGSGGFGRFALKARANVVGPSIALTNVNVELDGNVAEGVMTYANNGRQTLQATLAAGSARLHALYLDLPPARQRRARLEPAVVRPQRAVDRPISTCGCRRRRVTVGSTKLGRTAFGANLRGGALALSVGEAQMYGGIAKGSFGIARVRRRRRRQGPVPVHRCRPAGLRQPNCSASPNCPAAAISTSRWWPRARARSGWRNRSTAPPR